jgi:hypothetical protein
MGSNVFCAKVALAIEAAGGDWGFVNCAGHE